MIAKVNGLFSLSFVATILLMNACKPSSSAAPASRSQKPKETQLVVCATSPELQKNLRSLTLLIEKLLQAHSLADRSGLRITRGKQPQIYTLTPNERKEIEQTTELFAQKSTPNSLPPCDKKLLSDIEGATDLAHARNPNNGFALDDVGRTIWSISGPDSVTLKRLGRFFKITFHNGAAEAGSVTVTGEDLRKLVKGI